MKTLPRALSLLVLPIVICVASGSATAADPTPAELLKEYEALGLPLPPKEAKLVRFEGYGGGIVNGEVQRPGTGLAFEIKPGTKAEQPLLLWGTDESRPEWNPRTREVKPESAEAKNIEMLSADDMLALAMQCQARGWGELAQALLKPSQEDADRTPQKRLIELAWGYWTRRVTHPTADRAPVLKHIKALMEREPDLDTETSRRLVKSLELALAPSKAKPGSVEALIDALVDYNAETGAMSGREPGDAFWRIAERGFDAVPALIEHLGDDRLTRATMVGFNNFRSWNMRVGDVVGDLLEGLAAEELARGTDDKDVGGGWLRRQQGWPVKKSAALVWWEKAQKQGEEAYLLARVLPPAPKDDERAIVNVHLLRVIAAKYPKHVPTLYRKVLNERPDLDSWSLAKALAGGAIPAKDKLELFVAGAEHKDYAHRLPALREIKKLDQKRFDAILLATIESFPKDVSGEYWLCREGPIAGLAVESDDPKVWPTLEKVAKRSSLGLRMELLNHFGDSRELRHRAERLRLLSAFLDDAEVRDVKADKRYHGPGGGFPYDRIEVRDFVALELASLLEIEVELKLDRTSEEWAKVREKVREALKQEFDKKK
jgi:hypothetical protein